MKYQDTGNEWTFVLRSARKNSVNADIGGIGILLSPCALKSLNSIKRTQPRIMCVPFNSNHSTTIMTCYSPTNASDEIDIITCYIMPSSLM